MVQDEDDDNQNPQMSPPQSPRSPTPPPPMSPSVSIPRSDHSEGLSDLSDEVTPQRRRSRELFNSIIEAEVIILLQIDIWCPYTFFQV